MSRTSKQPTQRQGQSRKRHGPGAKVERRNYRLEYERRIAKALAAGKSRSAGRGHPTAADLPRRTGPIDRHSPLEKALARIKHGETQKAAAKAEGLSVEKLRLYQKLNTTSVRKGGKWVVTDTRPMPMWVATKGKLKSVQVIADQTSAVGRYWSAVNRFLDTNRLEFLEPFVGEGVKDVAGRFHPFELRPNTLRKLDSAGELDFLEIYADVAK